MFSLLSHTLNPCYPPILWFSLCASKVILKLHTPPLFSSDVVWRALRHNLLARLDGSVVRRLWSRTKRPCSADVTTSAGGWGWPGQWGVRNFFHRLQNGTLSVHNSDVAYYCNEKKLSAMCKCGERTVEMNANASLNWFRRQSCKMNLLKNLHRQEII